ncbi:MAG: polysaccharide deacetylase family protein [Flavobacterium sp.]|nr:polysaccharide deacetylase family protein [Flavobacterium sp.]
MNRFIAISAIAILASCNSKPAANSDKDSVVAKPQPGSIIKLDSSKRYIYLTWDDSPQPPGTIACKAVFRKQGVKATFFAVGMNQVGPFKKRIIDSLRNDYPEFLMANHSFSHANINGRDNYSLFYKQADNAIQDFLKNEKELNVGVKIIRLPGNNAWVSNGKIQGPKSTLAVCKQLDSMGYKVIGWDIEWNQYKAAPKESVAQMLKKVHDKFESGYTYEQNALVILSHDRLFGKPQYADSLSKFIAELKKDPRNVFETIDHYPSVMSKK